MERAGKRKNGVPYGEIYTYCEFAKECCKVWLDDVVYIENEGRRVKIVTDEKEFYLYAKVSDLGPDFDSD